MRARPQSRRCLLLHLQIVNAVPRLQRVQKCAFQRADVLVELHGKLGAVGLFEAASCRGANAQQLRSVRLSARCQLAVLYLNREAGTPELIGQALCCDGPELLQQLELVLLAGWQLTNRRGIG